MEFSTKTNVFSFFLILKKHWGLHLISNSPTQRVLNDFYRARLSRGPMFSLAPPPPPLSRQYARQAIHRKTEEERKLADGRGARGGRVAESFDRNKAWYSINHSILFDPILLLICLVQYSKLHSPIASNSTRWQTLWYFKSFFLFDSCPRFHWFCQDTYDSTANETII